MRSRLAFWRGGDARRFEGDEQVDITKLSGAIQQAQQRFQKADANGDGALSKAEFDAARADAPNGGSSGDQVFKAFDADGDGSLSQDELQAGVQAKIKAAMQSAMKNGGPSGAGGLGGGVKTDMLGALLQTSETDETDPNAQYQDRVQEALNEDPRLNALQFRGLVNKVV